MSEHIQCPYCTATTEEDAGCQQQIASWHGTKKWLAAPSSLMPIAAKLFNCDEAPTDSLQNNPTWGQTEIACAQQHSQAALKNDKLALLLQYYIPSQL